MHTVKWVAERLGLAPGTVRAWEQRYNVVHPSRSEGGYRLYDDEDFAVLRRMADLVAGGMQAAQAAQEIRSGGGGRRERVARPHAGMPDLEDLFAAARAFDARGMDAVLDAAFASAGFEYVVDTWLIPALRSVGEAWATGQFDVSHEHFVSAAVMRRLTSAFDAGGYARTGRHVLTGLAPGATHEIATLAFATMLRRRGLRVTYLGPDLPAASWVSAARTARPDAVVIGAPRPADARAATDVVRTLAASGLVTAVYTGGPGLVTGHALPGASLAAAADFLEDALTARPAGEASPT